MSVATGKGHWCLGCGFPSFVMLESGSRLNWQAFATFNRESWKYHLYSLHDYFGVGLISQEEKLGRTIAQFSEELSCSSIQQISHTTRARRRRIHKALSPSIQGDERAAVPNSIFTCFRQSKPSNSHISGCAIHQQLAWEVAKSAHRSWCACTWLLQVSDDDLMTTLCCCPTALARSKNNKKIADSLSSLDDLIAAETQKLDTLKTHKRA